MCLLRVNNIRKFNLVHKNGKKNLSWYTFSPPEMTYMNFMRKALLALESAVFSVYSNMYCHI